tara:strand:+ start:2063 stop:2413 length:351 start_codon:yes stop_codon:yes gene_type:complete
MKNTKFSIQTNIKKSNDYWFITLVCHHPDSSWKKNTDSKFKIKCPFEETIDMNIDDMNIFKSFCKDLGVPSWHVIEFMEKCIDIAVDEWQDINISNESFKWLQMPETVELLKRQTI